MKTRKSSVTQKPMEPLAAADLDIEELERRLELAAPSVQARSWDSGCATLCSCNGACPVLDSGGGGCGCN